MRILLNGLPREVPEGLTVAALLRLEQEPADHVLVEVDGVYLPTAEHAARTLREGQRVELILPAFGG